MLRPRGGFREGRSAHQAVRHVEACWKEGRRFAVDCDLKSFFDTVNHDRLMGQLREKVRDRKVLGLIRRYLQAGVVLPDGTREATRREQLPKMRQMIANYACVRNIIEQLVETNIELFKEENRR